MSLEIAPHRIPTQNATAPEAILRALLYIRLPESQVDERGFNLLRRAREEAGDGLSLAEFKRLVREQFFMLLLDERRSVEAIPAMLAKGPDLASRMAGNLHRLIDAVGLRSSLSKARLAEIEELIEGSASSKSETSSVAGRERRLVEPVRPAKSQTAARSKD